jgi:hypothetical protein
VRTPSAKCTAGRFGNCGTFSGKNTWNNNGLRRLIHPDKWARTVGLRGNVGVTCHVLSPPDGIPSDAAER